VRDGTFRPGKEGMSIGGMGLVNTYARLHYHFGPSCKITLENTDNGARVVIRAPLKGDERA